MTIDFPYLREPEFLSAKILPPEFSASFKECREFIAARVGKGVFNATEFQKMDRLVNWFKKPVDGEWLSQYRAVFYRFITTYDERRNVNFKRTFPELSDFLGLCRLEFVTQPVKVPRP